MESVQKVTLFGEVEPQIISIAESARRSGVSTATIRNWIKTGYLTLSGRGQITVESLTRFQANIAGTEKLNQRANKSLKDTHNHGEIEKRFLRQIESNKNSLNALGAKYESHLSDSYRNKEGIYYTPKEVVDDLFSLQNVKIGDATFCDPCCGSGNFVTRALSLGFKPENIFAFDVDQVAVELTKKRIYQDTGYESPNIKKLNFLKLATTPTVQTYDYIFTNPPWGKKIDKNERETIGWLLNSGKSLDTCSLFFFACLLCLKNNGKLGLLLPEAFFNIATFESARNRALDHSIERLVDYGKPFKGLVTKAQAIILSKTTSEQKRKIRCDVPGRVFFRSIKSFSDNPKSILNLNCPTEDSDTISHLYSIPHITLTKRAKWGLGIVTGNNEKFITYKRSEGYMPVYRGSDITCKGIKKPSIFIPSDISLYQQVAPLDLYLAKEKLIYKFISSKLCFFCDTQKRFILNSANMIILDSNFPISAKVLADLFNSNLMNWIFARIFDTHKILRGDLETLPIHTQFLQTHKFNESEYLDDLKIQKEDNGTYRVKR